MKTLPKHLSLSALSLATAVLVAACGGGDATPPPETVPPTINIASDVPGTAVGAVTFTFTFSEDVGDSFTASDVTVTDGTQGSFAKLDALQYTLVVIPTAGKAGTVGVGIADKSYADLVGNTGAAASKTQAFDTLPPTVTIASSAAGGTATGDITFSFAFSKDIGGTFTASDVTVAGGTAGMFTVASGTSATLVVSPTANAAGTVDITVPAGAVADAAGTVNSLAATAQQAYDTAVTVARTTIVSFDEATAPVFTGFGGSEDASVVVDPTNAANKVGRIVKAANAEAWAGATVSICPNEAIVAVPFSDAHKTMSARIWSPDVGIPVRLKLEDAADNTKTVETEAVTTVAGAWQTLSFNFASPATGTAALNLANTYNRSSIFFNFGKTGAEVGAAKTYYMDDLGFVGSTFTVVCPGGGGSGGSTALVTFDDPALTYKLTDFGGVTSSVVTDPAGGTGKVARVVKTLAAELWAGTTMSTGVNDSIATVPFTDTAKTLTMRVNAPAAGLPIRLKLEDAANNTHTAETEALTIAAGWQTLSFDFANPAPGTAALNLAFTYNKASVFPNFGKTGAQIGADSTYFFDDLSYVPAAAGGGTGTGSALVTFDDPALTYTLTDFGGTTSSVVTDPAGGTGKVAWVVKSVAAELWAGTTMSTGANQSIAKVAFTDTAKTMTMRVHAPAAGLPIRLKLEDAADNTRTVETEALTTAAGWQTLTFDFANPADGTAVLNLAYTYNKASAFPNFGKTGAQIGADSTYYFDDLTFVAPASGGDGGGGGATGLINLVGGVYASNYAETPTPWKSVEGGTAGRYMDTSVVTQDWWSGLAAADATPSFYFGYGINSGAKPWGFGGYVSAPTNGVANVAGYNSVQIAVWGNDELVNTKPNFTVIMKGPEVAGCTSELKGNIAVTANGVQTYTLPLNGFTLQTACAYASVATALAAGVKEIHIQVLGNNVQYTTTTDPANHYPNGLNIGPIKFQ